MAFSDAAARMFDSLFTRGGSAAKWKSGGGGVGVDCFVILAEPDEIVRFGQERAILPTVILRVRKCEIAEPAEDDTVDIFDADGLLNRTVKLVAEPTMEKTRLVFDCEAVRL